MDGLVPRGALHAAGCAIGLAAALALLAGCAAPQSQPPPRGSAAFHVFIRTGATGYKP